MIKAVFTDYTATVIREDGPVSNMRQHRHMAA